MIIGTQMDRSGYSNKQKRFRTYKEIAQELDYRQRQALPECVVDAIRSVFP